MYISQTGFKQFRHTIFILEKEWGAAALNDPICHDGDAVPQYIGFVHEVSGEHQCASLTVLLEDVPGVTTCIWIHSGCRLV